jgi:hypothetical protein
VDALLASVERGLREPGEVTTFTLVQAWARGQR